MFRLAKKEPRTAEGQGSSGPRGKNLNLSGPFSSDPKTPAGAGASPGGSPKKINRGGDSLASPPASPKNSDSRGKGGAELINPVASPAPAAPTPGRGEGAAGGTGAPLGTPATKRRPGGHGPGGHGPGGHGPGGHGPGGQGPGGQGPGGHGPGGHGPGGHGPAFGGPAFGGPFVRGAQGFAHGPQRQGAQRSPPHAFPAGGGAQTAGTALGRGAQAAERRRYSNRTVVAQDQVRGHTNEPARRRSSGPPRAPSDLGTASFSSASSYGRSGGSPSVSSGSQSSSSFSVQSGAWFDDFQGGPHTHTHPWIGGNGMPKISVRHSGVGEGLLEVRPSLWPELHEKGDVRHPDLETQLLFEQDYFGQIENHLTQMTDNLDSVVDQSCSSTSFSQMGSNFSSNAAGLGLGNWLQMSSPSQQELQTMIALSRALLFAPPPDAIDVDLSDADIQREEAMRHHRLLYALSSLQPLVFALARQHARNRGAHTQHSLALLEEFMNEISSELCLSHTQGISLPDPRYAFYTQDPNLRALSTASGDLRSPPDSRSPPDLSSTPLPTDQAPNQGATATLIPGAPQETGQKPPEGADDAKGAAAKPGEPGAPGGVQKLGAPNGKEPGKGKEQTAKLGVPNASPSIDKSAPLTAVAPSAAKVPVPAPSPAPAPNGRSPAPPTPATPQATPGVGGGGGGGGGGGPPGGVGAVASGMPPPRLKSPPRSPNALRSPQSAFLDLVAGDSDSAVDRDAGGGKKGGAGVSLTLKSLRSRKGNAAAGGGVDAPAGGGTGDGAGAGDGVGRGSLSGLGLKQGGVAALVRGIGGGGAPTPAAGRSPKPSTPPPTGPPKPQ